jgi:hypothetical protein
MIGDGSAESLRSGAQALNGQPRFDFVLRLVDIENLSSQWIDVDTPQSLLHIREVILVPVQDQHNLARLNLNVTQLAGVLTKSIDSNGIRRAEGIPLDITTHDNRCTHAAAPLSTRRRA